MWPAEQGPSAPSHPRGAGGTTPALPQPRPAPSSPVQPHAAGPTPALCSAHAEARPCSEGVWSSHARAGVSWGPAPEGVCARVWEAEQAGAGGAAGGAGKSWERVAAGGARRQRARGSILPPHHAGREVGGRGALKTLPRWAEAWGWQKHGSWDVSALPAHVATDW